jgi:putative FmdB family regulatory protein
MAFLAHGWCAGRVLMPLYEYHCVDCGQRIEVLRRFSDAPLIECPHCGGVLRKLPSAPSLQFKGSGFYLTDYGRSGGRKTEGGSEKSEGGKEAAPSTDSKPTAESKPAAETKAAAPSDTKAS